MLFGENRHVDKLLLDVSYSAVSLGFNVNQSKIN